MFFIFLVFFTEIFYFFLKNTDEYTGIILFNYLIVFFEKYINDHTELIGDLNNDGEITAADALYILQLSLDMRSFKKYDNIKANIDGKRGVTAADSMMILRYSIGYKDTNSLADNTFTYNSYDDPYFTV